MLFWPGRRRRPGPKGPNKELIAAVVALKQRNPSWGCPRIAQQIAFAFAIEIDKDVVRRILSAHYRPESDSPGPSWLTFLGHMKDSLWGCVPTFVAKRRPGKEWAGCLDLRRRVRIACG